MERNFCEVSLRVSDVLNRFCLKICVVRREQIGDGVSIIDELSRFVMKELLPSSTRQLLVFNNCVVAPTIRNSTEMSWS